MYLADNVSDFVSIFKKKWHSEGENGLVSESWKSC